MSKRKHVHVLGICGYAVSGAALMAQTMGYLVTGSDEDAYPPVSDTLTSAGINWVNQHLAENIGMHGLPELVVVGNQVREGNPEWSRAVELGIPVVSEVEFYVQLIGERTRVSICGTHGKTTTSSLLAYMLDVAGFDPGFRLGTTSRDFGTTARLGSGPFVIEGDEYTTAPWDTRPKFLHTKPKIAAVTRLELDHPDVYASLTDYRQPFVELAKKIPSDGLLLLCGDDTQCMSLAEHASCTVQTYGTANEADWRCTDSRIVNGLQHFTLVDINKNVWSVKFTMPGVYNAQNATAALALAAFLGAPFQACIEACSSFKGPSRRFEIVGEVNEITVVDDYAHHPTEVAAVIGAARQRYTHAKIFVIYVPHTYSRTKTLLPDYANSFVQADQVFIAPIEPARERHLEHTVNSHDVVAQIPSFIKAQVVDSAELAIGEVLASVKKGDVVLCLSVRGFDDIAHRLVKALTEHNDKR